MENAIDALKMAFAIFVFVMALSISITMFSELNETSKVLISARDITEYYHYGTSTEKTRTVGLESIIPTLYKYYTENYTVLFLSDKDENGDGVPEPLQLYDCKTDRSLWGNGTATGVIGKYYNNDKGDNNPVCVFDLSEETLRDEPWTGSAEDIKANIDAFLNGTKVNYTIKGVTETYDYSKYSTGGFYKKYSGRKFKEILGEYNYDLETEEESEGIVNSLLKGKKKRVIIYQLLP